MMDSQRKIQSRMIKYIALLLALVGVLASVFNYVTFVRQHSRQTGKYIGQITDQVALNIEGYLQEIARLCLSPYYNSSVMKALEERTDNARDFLSRKRVIENYLEEVMTIPRSDIVSVHILVDEVFGVSRTYGEGIPSDYMDRWWYQEALAQPEYVFLPNDGKTFSILHQIRSIDEPEKVIGVIKVDANFSRIKDICDRIGLDDRSALRLEDREGNILYDNGTLTEGRSIVSSRTIAPMDWSISYSAAMAPLVGMARFNLLLNIALALGFMAIGTLISSLSIRKMLDPLYNTVGIMNRVKDGETSLRAEEDCTPEIAELNRTFNRMLDQMENMADKERRLITKAAQAEVLQKQAQFEALYHQIHPHFLFNTLNTIILLEKAGKSEETVKAVEQLSRILRGMVNSDKLITLREEMDICECYIQLQRLRHDRLQYEIHLGSDVDTGMLLPAMIVQPVVENCFIHAYRKKDEDIQLSVDVSVDGTDLLIEVSDNGDGIPAAMLSVLRQRLEEEGNEGIGLANIHKRLSLMYGPGYGMTIESEYGLGTIVTLRLPTGGL